MGDQVKIDYQTLDELYGSLVSIIDELENARDNSGELEEAISTPFGRDRLKSEAHRFMDQWDDKRAVLRDDCKTVRDHTKALLDGWSDWDRDAADKLAATEA